MKSKHTKFIALLLVTVIVGTFIWWLRNRPSPSLSFVEFRTDQHGQLVAVFRASNTSDQPFSYLGYSASMPWYYYRLPTASGWRQESGFDCGTGIGYFEFPPHSALDFNVWPPHAAPKFAVGVSFERATPAEIHSRSRSLFAELNHFIWGLLTTPQRTWSEPVTIKRPEAPNHAQQ